MALASYQSYLARRISTEFSESEYIGKAIACILVVSFVGVPTVILVSEEPRAKYFFLTSLIFVIATSVLLFVFVPKILTRRKADRCSIRNAIRESTLNVSQQLRGNFVLQTPQDTSGSFQFAAQSSDLDSSLGSGVKILSRPEDVQEITKENEKLKSQLADARLRLSELQGLVSEQTAAPGKDNAEGNDN
jgi:hypothetical protein